MNISLETKLFTPKEVANFLRLTTHQVNRLCRKGVLRRIKLSERIYRIPEDAVLEFIRQAAVAGALEHPNGNQEKKWNLPSEHHLHRSQDGPAETLPEYAWDDET